MDTRITAAACAALLVAIAGCGPKTVSEGPAAAREADARVIAHTMAPGETLAQVADNYYGDPARASAVAADNGLSDADRVAAGSVLELRFSKGEWERAQRRAAALGPYNRGVEQMGADRLAEAEESFRLALQAAPDLHAARYNLALVLVQRGKADEAVGILGALCDERPNDADFRYAYGHALFMASRADEAAVAFRTVLAADPANRRAAFGLARALEAAGDEPGAIAAWERYLALDADSGWANQARSRLRALRHGG
ncbi:MAG TPA: tetratricopeptide repeat protein [Candidatus Krumholzibacteria bacterium]|nr:tetratricopeptide repeat protein [Candidatus Krumholzibacteria bacterium]